MALSPALSELLGETSVSSLYTSYSTNDYVLNKTCTALTATVRQEDLGIRQRARPAGPQRQASNPLRRRHARRLQARPRAHVHHEQDPQPKPLRHGRRVNGCCRGRPATHTACESLFLIACLSHCLLTLHASTGDTTSPLDIYGLWNYTNEVWASTPLFFLLLLLFLFTIVLGVIFSIVR